MMLAASIDADLAYDLSGLILVLVSFGIINMCARLVLFLLAMYAAIRAMDDRCNRSVRRHRLTVLRYITEVVAQLSRRDILGSKPRSRSRTRDGDHLA